MQINNDHWYLNELEKLMSEFIDKNEVGEDVGYIPDNADKLMADAAFNVLRTIKDVNNYFQRENMLS